MKSDTSGNPICSFYNPIALDLSRGNKHLILSGTGVSVPLALLTLKPNKRFPWKNPKITQISPNVQKSSLLLFNIVILTCVINDLNIEHLHLTAHCAL